MTEMTFYEKLSKIQNELKAPKSQFNKFGNYHYRNCEDILEAVKPLLDGLLLSISDDIVNVGDRFYIKAIATITDGKTSHSVSAFARESLDKKGMDHAQLTGATSSYARKYALNGLFCIDDTKDADANEYHESNSDKPSKNDKPAKNSVKKAQDNRTPEQYLHDFTEWAYSCTSSADLQKAYKSLCKRLANTPELAEKANEVYTIKLSELE